MNESKTPLTDAFAENEIAWFLKGKTTQTDINQHTFDFARSLEVQLAEANDRINKRTERIHEMEKVCHEWCMDSAKLTQQRDRLAARVMELEKALKLAVEEYDAGGKCWHSFEVIGEMRATLHSSL